MERIVMGVLRNKVISEPPNHLEKEFQVEGTGSAKALRQEQGRHADKTRGRKEEGQRCGRGPLRPKKRLAVRRDTIAGFT